jgi:hypothetical protein
LTAASATANASTAAITRPNAIRLRSTSKRMVSARSRGSDTMSERGRARVGIE